MSFEDLGVNSVSEDNVESIKDQGLPEVVNEVSGPGVPRTVEDGDLRRENEIIPLLLYAEEGVLQGIGSTRTVVRSVSYLWAELTDRVVRSFVPWLTVSDLSRT